MPALNLPTLNSSTLLGDIGIVIAIILVDLALSGDNALVIGSVASKLSVQRRRRIIFYGGMIAIVLRIALTFLATRLLLFPFVSAIGGVLVFIIALELIRDVGKQPEEESNIENPRSGRRALSSDASFMPAIVTIAIADFSMSLDNALAIAALAKQNYLLLAIGLFLSVIFLLIASAGIASLIARFPVLMYLSGLILALTAGGMVLGDQRIGPLVGKWDNGIPGPLPVYIQIGVVVVFALLALLFRPKSHTTIAGHVSD